MVKKKKNKIVKKSEDKFFFDFLNKSAIKKTTLILSVILVGVSILYSFLCFISQKFDMGVLFGDPVTGIIALLIPSIVFLIYNLEKPFSIKQNTLFIITNILAVIIILIYFSFIILLLINSPESISQIILQLIISIIICLSAMCYVVSSIFKLKIINFQQLLFLAINLSIVGLISVFLSMLFFAIFH